MEEQSPNLDNAKFFRLKYGGYENPKAFEPYTLILLLLDFVFNWVIDWAHSDPLAILVIFVFQCLGLIVNLIIYVMASASQAMQTGLRRSLIYHHQLHLMTSLLYISLTCSWYIWALKKSWPSVSDQFSFSFGSEDNSEISTISTTTPSTTTTLIVSLLNATEFGDNNTNSSTPKPKFLRSFSFIRNLFPTSSPKTDLEASGGNLTREFYTLWSPGFVALYTIQRTIGIIYYLVCLKATFLVLNVSNIDSLERSGGEKRITMSLGRDNDEGRDELPELPTLADLQWGASRRQRKNLGEGKGNKKASTMASVVSEILKNANTKSRTAKETNDA